MAASVLIFVHPPYYDVEGEIFFDRQAQNGLRLWAADFQPVRVIAPLVKVAKAPSDAAPLQPFLDAHPEVEPAMLPRPGTAGFLRALPEGRKIIRENIRRSDYLVFGFAGYVGDWGTVACREAARMGRPYAVFKDSVAHHVLAHSQAQQPRGLATRLRHAIELAYMRWADRRTVAESDLALLHGQTTMDYYAPFASNPHLVHDIHISPEDRIAEAALNARLAARDGTLRAIYVGRVEEIKGPDHWRTALLQARALGASISARWLGNGALLDAQQAKSEGQDAITFSGFVDHAQIMPALKQADVFVFAHMTDESPRCLIEALNAGLPIVGFDSRFARDLVAGSDAGLFVERGDSAALANAIAVLADDPERVAHMSQEARRVAAHFNDAAVFRERAEIIKAGLPQRKA